MNDANQPFSSRFSSMEEFNSLWRVPWLAPDVPPKAILASFLVNQDRLPNDTMKLALASHIDRSEGCRQTILNPRFLESFEKVAAPIDDLKLYLEELRAKPADEIQLKPGALCWPMSCYPHPATTPEAWVWNFRCGPILLLEAAQDGPGELRHARGVVCSLLLDYPEEYMTQDDTLIECESGAVLVAHLDLSYPIATTQIRAVFDFAKDATKEARRIATLWRASCIEGIPLEPESDRVGYVDTSLLGPESEIAKARKRLMLESEFLGAPIWTELQRLSQLATPSEDTLQVTQNGFKQFASRAEAEELPLAAASVYSTPQKIIFGEISGDQLRLRISMDKQKAKVRVEDANGMTSTKFSRGEFLDASGRVVGTISGAACTLGAPKAKTIVALRTSAGIVFAVSWLES